MLGVDRSGEANLGRSPLSAAAELASRHALLLIVGVGAAIRFATLGTQDIWLDEHITRDLILQGPIELLQSVQRTESNPVLYYLIAGGWERLFGSSDFGLRSLPALAGTAAIPVLYAAGSEIGSRRAGLIAAALTAFSPLLIWYSQELRNYSLLVLLAALSFLFFVRALDERGQRWLWGWALIAALSLTTHYFAIFLIVGEAAWLLLRRPGPRLDTVLPMGAIAAVGVALLPLVATQRGRGSWIDDYSLSDRLAQIPEQFLVGLQVPWEFLPTLAVGIVGLVLGYAAVRTWESARRAIAITWTIVLGGVALLLVSAVAGDDYILVRNLLELWPPFAVGVAVVLSSDAVRRLGPVTVAGLCAAGLALAIWTAATPEAQRPKYSELAAELGPTSEKRLIVSQSSFSSPLTLDLDRSRFAGDDDLEASELVVIEPKQIRDYGVGTCWWIHTCGGIDLEPPPRFEVPAGFELQRSGSTRLFDYDVYRAPEPTPIERPLEYFTPRVFVQTPAS